MKLLPFSAFLLLSPVCLAQRVEIATEFSPEDLGAYKWVFSGTAGENSVVVFRVTTVREWPDGKTTTAIHDTVHYAPGKKQAGTAFFIDPRYFEPKEEEPRWHFRALGGTGWIEGRYAGHSHGDNKGEINFESGKWGKTKKVFETFIKSYDHAVAMYGELPEIAPDAAWTWAGSPKARGEQAVPEQAANRPGSKPEGSSPGQQRNQP